jgi:2-dehydropantoate 2-reductase
VYTIPRVVCQRDGNCPLVVVGAGSLGQAFAGLLAHSGQPVLLLATPRTAQHLFEQRGVRLSGAVALHVPVALDPAPRGSITLATDARTIPAAAGVIFTTKGHQLAAASQAVQSAWRPTPEAWVAGVQNGLAKDDVLAEVFGPHRVVGGVTILGAQRGPHSVYIGSLGQTFFGEFDQTPSQRVRSAVAALEASGIPTEVAPSIHSVLWSKACNAAGVFGVSVLTRLSAQRMNGSPHLVRAYLALVRETAAIAHHLGVALGDYPGFPIQTYLDQPDEATVDYLTGAVRAHPLPPGQPETYPSMTQDLLAGRGLEVEDVFADLVRRGERAGMPVPRLRLVRDLLRGLDELQPSTARAR